MGSGRGFSKQNSFEAMSWCGRLSESGFYGPHREPKHAVTDMHGFSALEMWYRKINWNPHLDLCFHLVGLHQRNQKFPDDFLMDWKPGLAMVCLFLSWFHKTLYRECRCTFSVPPRSRQLQRNGQTSFTTGGQNSALKDSYGFGCGVETAASKHATPQFSSGYGEMETIKIWLHPTPCCTGPLRKILDVMELLGSRANLSVFTGN